VKLVFTPWQVDPDPPDRMTDEQIEAMAERCFQYMKERHQVDMHADSAVEDGSTALIGENDRRSS
jgi:hypothetical protein